ncbi:histone deacetylase 6-like [Sycon ciliatum]|uniref:histone deacetylase 6-like n=1 Tax=Sycon ciliatum TaxID=27933 RepID=UPI0031F631C4
MACAKNGTRDRRNVPLSEQLATLSQKQKEMREQGLNTTRPVAVIYDEGLTAHKPFFKHQLAQPEVPLRVETVIQTLYNSSSLHKCDFLPGRHATRDELLRVHTEAHLDLLESFPHLSDQGIMEEEKKHDSIYISRDTYPNSVLAAGCTLEATERVLTKKNTHAVAVVRPPGHHASADKPSGFCFLNNVAIAVRHAQQSGVQRILILDWDIHHGNGTQSIFENDPNVLFISLHRYDNGLFYPNTKYAGPQSVGTDAGAGYSVNIGWNESGLHDADYKYAFESVVLPIAKSFNPELVFVSAGFDGADGDPLGVCKLKPRIYSYMTLEMMNLSQSGVILVLEGGYNCTSTANCMTACVDTLLTKKAPSFVRNSRKPTRRTIESVNATKAHQRAYWSALPATDDPVGDSPAASPINGDETPELRRTPESEGEAEGATDEEAQEKAQASCAAGGGAEAGVSVLLASKAMVDAATAATSASAAACADSEGAAARAKKSPLELTMALLAELQLEESGGQKGFHVYPKPDCPHVESLREDFPDPIDLRHPCEKCDETFENWMCLGCHAIACGREVKAHMLEHNRTNPDHPLVVSFADLSVWCYDCDSYIDRMQRLRPKLEALHQVKFGVKAFEVHVPI